MSIHNKQGLQWFTLDKILSVDRENLEQFSEEELELLRRGCLTGLNEALNDEEKSRGDDIDKYWQRVYWILELMGQDATSTRNQQWEINHQKIIRAINSYFREYPGSPPSVSHIAAEAGLSRPTVYKHLKEGAGSHRYQQELDNFRYMTVKVLGILYTLVQQGDLKAIKIYLDYFKDSPSSAPAQRIGTQNNYIQINNTRLSEETLQVLPPSALEEIESIINQALSEEEEPEKAVKYE